MSIAEPKLSFDVVIPVFNSEDWILSCVSKIRQLLDHNNLGDAKIIVVNDGSTDDTLHLLENCQVPNLHIVSQENMGRLRAREVGAQASVAEFILFIDSRVTLHANSLRYVLPHLKTRDLLIWTCDVHAEVSNNYIARFWKVIEMVFWSRYHRNPKLHRITPHDFDYFPKGTTALISPRLLFLEATEQCMKNNKIHNLKKVNDDTAILRYMVNEKPIAISPEYSCSYNARSRILPFLRHAFHRGAVLIDGHWRRGARLQHLITASFFIVPLLFGIFVLMPKLTIAAFAIALTLVFISLSLSFIGWSNGLVFVLLLPVFSISYFAGMCHGVGLRIRGVVPTQTHLRDAG